MALCSGRLLTLVSEQRRVGTRRTRVSCGANRLCEHERCVPGEVSQPVPAILRTRRSALALSAGALLSAAGAPASAFDLPGSKQLETGIPKAYMKDSRDLIETLRESILFEEAETGERNFEREFRRRAEPAQNNVKKWIATWKGSERVEREESYSGIVDAIQALGKFYREKGSRTPLTMAVRDEVLEALDRAEAALSKSGRQQAAAAAAAAAKAV